MRKKLIPVVVCFILVCFLCTGGLLSKDLTIGINYDGSYTDNVFLNASEVSDYISRFRADIGYSFRQFNIYLDAGAGIYAGNPDFNSFEVEPGVEWMLSLRNRDTLYVSGGYRVLNYKELYSDFNYSGPRLQVGVKLYKKSQTILKAGYWFESRNYSTFESFDYYNHSVFVELDRFFKSQTTLRFEARLNYRFYPHIADDYDFGDDYNYFQQHRHQGNQGGQGGGHGGGPGQGGGPGAQSETPQTQYSSSSLGIPNLNGLFRISQGIGTKLGLTGEAQARWNFKGLEDAESLIKNAYILYPFHDDELWNGFRLSLGFKAVIGKSLSVEGKASYFDKSYPGVFIMNELGEVVEPVLDREDSLTIYSLKFSRDFGKFGLFADIVYRDNDSNDEYFLYNMVTVSAGVGYYF